MNRTTVKRKENRGRQSRLRADRTSLPEGIKCQPGFHPAFLLSFFQERNYNLPHLKSPKVRRSTPSCLVFMSCRKRGFCARPGSLPTNPEEEEILGQVSVCKRRPYLNRASNLASAAESETRDAHPCSLAPSRRGRELPSLKCGLAGPGTRGLQHSPFSARTPAATSFPRSALLWVTPP